MGKCTFHVKELHFASFADRLMCAIVSAHVLALIQFDRNASVCMISRENVWMPPATLYEMRKAVAISTGFNESMHD